MEFKFQRGTVQLNGVIMLPTEHRATSQDQVTPQVSSSVIFQQKITFSRNDNLKKKKQSEKWQKEQDTEKLIQIGLGGEMV